MRAVLDYRAAGQARDLMNAGDRGYAVLAQSEGLMRLLLELLRAQTGRNLETGEALAIARERADDAQARIAAAAEDES